MSFSSSQEFNIELGGVGVSADQMAHAFVLTCENNSVNSRFNRLHLSKGNNFRFFVFQFASREAYEQWFLCAKDKCNLRPWASTRDNEISDVRLYSPLKALTESSMKQLLATSSQPPHM